jgi:hypothetical protein
MNIIVTRTVQEKPVVLVLDYPADAVGRSLVRQAKPVWALAASLRRQIGGAPLTIERIVETTGCLRINGRRVRVSWECAHAVHDDLGRPVLGVCETDPEDPDAAFVSINGPALGTRADLVLSTAAHELGHVVFDVPGALAQGPQRRFRSRTGDVEALYRGRDLCERRANEFMGALLAPPFELHRELLRHARDERLRLTRARHHGRPGCPAVSADNDPDAIAGVTAVLADAFGVSSGFIAVRLQRYGLIASKGEG